MLSMNQLSDLDSTAADLHNKQLILNTAIDVQVILQLLVEKEIVTREEVASKRETVRSQPKYKNAITNIEQNIAEVLLYKENPQALLKHMMDMKLKGGK
jgi:hypothetical protein